MTKNFPAIDAITSKNAISSIFSAIFGICLSCNKKLLKFFKININYINRILTKIKFIIFFIKFFV